MNNEIINKENIKIAIEELTVSRNRYANLIPVAKHQFELEEYRKRKTSLDNILLYLDNIELINNKLEPELGKGIDGFFKHLFLEVKQNEK